MKFVIHFTIMDRYGEPHDDSFICEGPTPEDIRKQAEKELSLRGGIEPWSEEISDDRS